MRTLVFCTAYAGRIDKPWEAWDVRYKRWVSAIRSSTLIYDQVLLIDDGSPTLPEWPETTILSELPEDQPTQPVVVYHFADNLGRPSVYDYPGWFRSFCFAFTYANAFGFTKIIHIESDAFLVSARIQEYCNKITDGWVTFFGPHHSYPETGIQVIAGEGLDRYERVTSAPYSDYVGKPIELHLPFTHVERGFKGDRYGAFLSFVPNDADWTMQTHVPNAFSDAYHWWLPPSNKDLSMKLTEALKSCEIQASPDRKHPGVPYLEFMKYFSESLAVRNYFEIGTNKGASLKAVHGDAVAVDPNFEISSDVFSGRTRAFFFQMTSDAFFKHQDLRIYFPIGFDLAFLDGLHLFEALLRDFINTERHSHSKSVILVHDCLPLNSRMAERKMRIVETEDVGTRLHWTGDVWKLLLVLKKYRPDLNVLQFDCPPTGLICCSGLNQFSRVLADNYDEIVAEFSSVSLDEFGLDNAWKQFPAVNTRLLSSSGDLLPALLFGS